MSTKSQTVFAVCFGLFLAVVVTVSLLFADKLPHATQPEGITGGYISFSVHSRKGTKHSYGFFYFGKWVMPLIAFY